MANCKQYFYVRLSWWGCLCILLYGFNSSWRDKNILASLGKSSKLWWTTVQIMLGPRYVVVPFTSIYSLPSLVGKQNESRFNNCQCPISYLISHNLPLQGPSASASITYWGHPVGRHDWRVGRAALQQLRPGRLPGADWSPGLPRLHQRAVHATQTGEQGFMGGGGGEVWHPCFVVRLAASNVFLVLTFSSWACSDPHAPPLPSSMLITPLSPPQQYADYVPHNGQRPGPGAVGFNYSCMVSTQPQGYAPAQPCYMTVTQPAPQVPVEQIPTTAHAHMNGTVYSEAGHVVYDDSVGETVGEHDEYITMTMSKLFNGECELEKVDGLPSINSLLCEAAMWVVSGQRSLGKMESAAGAEGSHGRGHPNWPVYRGPSLVCGDVTRRKGNNGPATGGLYTSASFLDSQPRPYGPRSILCQWTGVGPWGRSRRPASRYVILIVLYFILCTENFGDSLPLY